MAHRSDVKALIRAARRAGLLVRIDANSHWHVATADGQRIVTISQAPGSAAAVREAKSHLRRHGVDVGDRRRANS